MSLHILSLVFPDDATLIATIAIDLDNRITIDGTLVDMVDGVIVHFNLSYWVAFLGTVITADVFVEIEDLGDVELNIQITTSEAFGGTSFLDIDSDFEVSDLIEWLTYDDSDGTLRDQLIAILPVLEKLTSVRLTFPSHQH